MERLSICRICFVENDLMHSIENTNLQITYELLSATPFVTNDCRPLQLCYICCAKLRNCYEFQVSCLHSEQILTQKIKNTQFRQLPAKDMRNIKVKHPLINISIIPTDTNGSDVIVIDNDEKKGALDVTVHVKVEEIDDNTDLEVPKDDFDQTSCFQTYNHGTTEENFDSNLDIQTVDAKDDIDYQSDEIIIENQIEMASNQSREFVIQHENSFSNKEVNKEDRCFVQCSKVKSVKDLAQTQNIYADNIIALNFVKQHKPHTSSIDYKLLKDVKVVLNKMELGHLKEDFNVEGENIEKRHQAKTKKGARVRKMPKSILKQNSCLTKLRKVETKVKFDLTENMLINTDKTYKNCNSLRPKKKKYKCDICEKQFYQKHHLIEHNRKHTGEKPYKCNICEKAFTFHNVLNNHILIHSDEKPHKCYICGKCFNLNINLMRHIRSHTNERPHKCNVCNKCFNCKQHLKIHMRIHTGEKPYKCDICSKCFNQKNNLNIHIRSVHTCK